MLDAFGIKGRLGPTGSVDDRLRMKNRKIGDSAFPDDAAIGEFKIIGRHAGDLQLIARPS